MSQREIELTRTLSDALTSRGLVLGTDADLVSEAKQWFFAATLHTTGQSPFSEAHVMHVVGRLCSHFAARSIPPPKSIDEIRLCWLFLGSLLRKEVECPGSIADLASQLIREVVELHYAVVRPPMFDLFAHLSANEMFFIDGDSLVIEALCKPSVDWDLMQPLHVQFFAQRILQEFLARGARFHVVFFDSGAWLWRHAPQKYLIRELIKECLLNLSTKPQSKFVVKNFPSWWSSEYLEHFENFDPEFVMMTDGEQMAEQTLLQLSFTLSSDSTFRSVLEDESTGSRAALYYHCFMMNTITAHAQVVFSSRLVFKDNAVAAFVVRSSSDRFAQYLLIRDRVEALAKTLASTSPCCVIPALNLDAQQQKDLSSGDMFVCFRERVVAGAIAGFLASADRSDVDVAFCRVLLVCTFAAALVPAEARAQPVTGAPELKAFLESVAPFVLAAIRAVGVETGKGQEFDPIDGHLAFAFARLMRTTPLTELLSQDYTDAMLDCWNNFVGETGSIVDPVAVLPEFAAPSKVELRSLAPVKHELVSHLARVFDVPLPSGAQPYPSGLGACRGLLGWNVAEPFDDHNDVINVGRVLDEREKQLKDAKANAKKLTAEAKWVGATQETAQTLGGPMFLGPGESLAIVADKKEQESQQDKSGPKKSHAGQKVKYVRTSKDRIREENNLRLVRQNNTRHINALNDLLSRSERFNEDTRQTDRDNAVFSLQQNMDSYAINEVLINEHEVSPGPGFVKVELWRALVTHAKKLERDVALDSKMECLDTAKSFVDEDYKKFQANRKLSDTSKHQPVQLAFVYLDGEQERADAKDTAVRFVQQLCLFYVEAHYLAAVELRILRVTFHEWLQERETARLNSRKPEHKKSVKLFQSVQRVMNRLEHSGIRLPNDDVALLRSAIRHLEFPESYNKVFDGLVAQYQSQPVGSLPENMKPRHTLLSHTVARFQLCEMGELLERPVPPFRDPRVSFKPDTWQRELMDVLDNRGSAVVCAPTSAGKTFISYYCMKNTLMTNNDRIVVYVAPTRALINQAVADVCQRFSSKKYVNPGLHVYGCLGGDDYHHDHDTCQVLITLPEVFETMLLSPKYVEWAKRVDYVIFDEIHSMESSGNGPVWERILSLTTAPFVALSATLGETEQLCQWLNRIQANVRSVQASAGVAGTGARDYSVTVFPKAGERIQRWNDIEKYVYQPPPGCDIPFTGTDKTFEFQHIAHLHPLSTVTLTMLRGKFPPELSLVPKECVALYDIMKKLYTPLIESYSDVDAFADIIATMQRLEPETYFAGERHIVQVRAREYEATIKQELLKWAQLGVKNMHYTLTPLSAEEIVGFREDMTDVVKGILATFQEHLRDGEEELKQHSLRAKDINVAPFPDSQAFVKKYILNVLRELKERDRRPTIVFSFEPEDCDALVEHVVTQLEEAEAAYRSSKEFEQYEKAMNARKEEAEVRRRLRESRANQGDRPRGRDEEGGRENERERNVDERGGDEEANHDIPEVLPQFAFFGKGEYNHQQFEKILKTCQEQGNDLVARALKRGICIHHNAIPGKLRRSAENMFRSLYCSVIFATETLALGVHSPCRSVVLAGDHILLNTTQFRQMMGRAGRRGLDFLGHLIFMGVSLKKVNRLMTSDLMVIKGHVQVDPITSLRLLQLHDFDKQRELQKKEKELVQWKDDVRNVAARIFTNPLYFIGRERMNGNMEGFQVRLLQALLRYLHSEGLHFAENEGTSSIGSLITNVTHIFRNAESHISGFLFAHMITSGLLQDVKFTHNMVDPSPEVTFEAIAEALAYAFTVNTLFNVPMEVHRSAMRSPDVEALWSFPTRKFGRTHRVVLTPMRHLNLAKLETRKRAFMALLSAFYTQESSYLASAHDNRLPFMTMKYKDETKTSLIKFNIFAEEVEETEAVVRRLKETAAPYRARHPVAAVSGLGDQFQNVEELCLTLRDDGLFADVGMFPYVDLTDNSRHEGSQILVNACLTDFLRVGAQTEGGEYRRTLLQTLNGLTQHDSYTLLTRIERIFENLTMSKKEPTSAIRETLREIMPRDASLPTAQSANAVLQVSERLIKLERQITGEAWLDRREEMWARMSGERQAQQERVRRAQ